MITNSYSTGATLSGIYTQNSNNMAQSLARLGSQRRVVQASDDVASYIKAADLEGQASAYTSLKGDIASAKSAADYAKTVGSQVVEDLTRLQELNTMYNATADADKQAAYTADYNAVVDRLTATIADSEYDGTSVYGTALISSANINLSGGSIDVQASDAADAAAVGAIGSFAVAELTSAQTYLAEISSQSKHLENTQRLADVNIASSKSAAQALVGLDEVQEMASLSSYQVRSQAVVSMMAQSNMSQQGLARLFM